MFKGKITGRKFFFISALSATILFTSCSSDSEKQKILLDALNESIINSSRIIHRSTEIPYSSLKNKLLGIQFHSNAEIWYPKANMVRELSNGLVASIDSLRDLVKRNVGLTSDQISGLTNNFVRYKNSIWAIDAGMTSAFNGTLIFTTQSFDTIRENEQNFSFYFFENRSRNELLYLLNKFENNIRIIENKLVQYCDNKVGAFVEHFTRFSAIVAQSSTCVKPGEAIEITAGVGSFSKAAQPQITINGNKVDINEMAYATYRFNSSAKPGKYFIPVEISFTDEEGIKRNETKRIEYTVAPPNNK